MKGNIQKRLKTLEHEIITRDEIPDKEKIVVIVYPNGDTDHLERLKQERLAELREKYGTEISENDILFVAIRQFYRKCPFRNVST